MAPTAAKRCAICKREVITESSDEDDLQMLQPVFNSGEPSNVINLVGDEPPTRQSTNLAPSNNNLATSSNTSASTNLSAIFDNTCLHSSTIKHLKRKPTSISY